MRKTKKAKGWLGWRSLPVLSCAASRLLYVYRISWCVGFAYEKFTMIINFLPGERILRVVDNFRVMKEGLMWLSFFLTAILKSRDCWPFRGKTFSTTVHFISLCAILPIMTKRSRSFKSQRSQESRMLTRASPEEVAPANPSEGP